MGGRIVPGIANGPGTPPENQGIIEYNRKEYSNIKERGIGRII
jgi:hypothetical protein